jgi:hypothetical protein
MSGSIREDVRIRKWARCPAVRIGLAEKAILLDRRRRVETRVGVVGEKARIKILA